MTPTRTTDHLTLTDTLLAAVLVCAAGLLALLAWIGWTGRNHTTELGPIFVGVASDELLDELAPGPGPLAPPPVVLIEIPHDTPRFDGLVVS